jgi:hypothetical protein
MRRPITIPATIDTEKPRARALRLWTVALNSCPLRISSTNAPVTAVG